VKPRIRCATPRRRQLREDTIEVIRRLESSLAGNRDSRWATSKSRKPRRLERAVHFELCRTGMLPGWLPSRKSKA
jgi:hypothetical protein